MQRKGSGRCFHKKGPPSGREKPLNKNEGPQDVHRRNIRLVAQPVLLLFNLLRFLAFQLWLGLTLLCGSRVLPVKNSMPCQQKAKDECKINITEMTHRQPNAGPGEPVLVEQKKHHRKAFEYISKALKIDEDEKGRNCYYILG